MIFKLALRNIVRNPQNSAIIAVLLGVITLLFFTGNSILARTGRGLRRSYVESLTGDLIIEKKGEVTMNLFGANAPIVEDYFTIPVLPAGSLIAQKLRTLDEVAGFAGQVSTKAVMEHAGRRVPALICGVDGGDYFPLFPGIRLEQGRLLQTGEDGAMLTAAAAADLERQTGVPLAPGDLLVFTAAGSAGFKIRQVPLTGIFSYESPSGFMNSIVFTDAQTARVLSQIQVATADVQVAPEALTLLTLDDADLFGDALFAAATPEAAVPSAVDEPEAAVPSAVDGQDAAVLEAVDGQEAAVPNAVDEPEAAGDWNFFIVRLKSGVNAGLFAPELNRILEEYGAEALGWRLAAGGTAIIVLMLAALFNGGMVLVSVAGIIAVVNILLIAVFRRTREIGTLRAIGATGGAIRALILSENALLGLIAGALACLAGAALLWILNAARLPVTNEILAALLGGTILHIEFSPALAAASFAVALVLSVAASLYPIETAVRIEPVVALRQG